MEDTLIIPTIYAAGLHLGLQSAVVELGNIIGVPSEQFGEWYLTHSWPFSFEYVLFAALFVTSIWLLYDEKGLKIFAVSSFFIAGVGTLHDRHLFPLRHLHGFAVLCSSHGVGSCFFP